MEEEPNFHLGLSLEEKKRFVAVSDIERDHLVQESEAYQEGVLRNIWI